MIVSPVDLSLSELEALALKAAKGAGFSWGIAAEAGKACRWLHTYGLDGAHALLSELRTGRRDAPNLKGNKFQLTAGFSVLALGSSLCDHAHLLQQKRELFLPKIDEPLLLLPFVARLSKSLKQPLHLATGEQSFLLHEVRAAILDYHGDVASVSILQNCPATKSELLAQTRAKLGQDGFAGLSSLASKTYAPATDSSRLAGAGAGLNDND